MFLFIDKLEKRLNNNLIKIILAGFIGLCFFILIRGMNILNPSYIDWILDIQDSTFHFVGWHFFRNDGWQFPIGKISNYGYPISAIAYTDSIPLFAIFFKIFSPILPTNFQYFGIWILTCYILQGIFGFLLMKQITNKSIIQLIGTIIFVFSPPMLLRFQGHFALMGHWVLLASIWLYLKEKNNLLKEWFIIISVSLLIHPYLWIMVLGIFFAYLFKRYFFQEKKYVFLFLNVVISLLLSLFIMWQIGLFTINSSNFSTEGYEWYSMNVTSLINPIDNGKWSNFLMTRQQGGGQYEGFNYLGFGMIILLIFSIYYLFDFIVNKKYLKTNFNNKYLPLLIISILFTIFSLSNIIQCDTMELLRYPLPLFLKKIFGIFRSSGRLFWIVYYLIVLLFIYNFINKNSYKLASIFLIFIVFIQLYDISNAIMSYRKNLKFKTENKILSMSKKIDKLIKSNNIKKITILPLFDGNDIDYQSYYQYSPFAIIASSNELNINFYYAARFSDDFIEYIKLINTSHLEGKFEENSLYIIKNQYFDKYATFFTEKDLILNIDNNDKIFIKNGKK
ncbi:MAG: hypothetical protein A2086_16500 [Spirochaetes bacterium GWD1_27_9]|nr:MAG: hypothetical protein A2Z98_01385 [Spirochaetes bacterium GWB1_27_13]OHD28306.1 MAG: hypothetical protein A2Y34_09840 [Spirochaetes bacterium GWC1_27_15]OHD29195.1 MAG: hypothetical protein A2086_16500 [Spirochaetes bacterium GWD1_27_9]